MKLGSFLQLCILLCVSIFSTVVAMDSPKASNTPVEENIDDTSFNILLLILTMVICIITTFVLWKFNLKFIPESVAAILFGILCGAIVTIYETNIDQVLKLDKEVFFLIFLPIIIYESGYNLDKGPFFSNFGSILAFAIVGTALSTFVIGMGLGLLGFLSWSDSFAFAALISAVDPIATITCFKSMKIETTLSILVFGESVLNDVASIVLYRTFISLSQHPFTFSNLMYAFAQFITVSVLSVLIGVLIAIAAALVFKFLNFREYPSLEGILMIILMYIPYVAAESVNCSGILAILCNAIVNSQYTHYNLSASTQITIQQVVQMFSFTCETIVFAYLGLAVFTFEHRVNIWLISVSLLLCFVGRAVNIFPLSYVLNFKRTIKISFVQQVIMWFSGLRGAIAFSLALTFPSQSSPQIFTCTLVIILFTSVLIGGCTFPLLKTLQFVEDQLEEKKNTVEFDVIENTPSGVSLFAKLDEQYFKKWFRIAQHAETESIHKSINQMQLEINNRSKHMSKSQQLDSEEDLVSITSETSSSDKKPLLNPNR